MATLATIINSLVRFYEIVILVWCIFSWIPQREGSLLYDFATVVDSLVRPFISLFSRFIPPIGGIDFSPMIAVFALEIVERLLLTLI